MTDAKKMARLAIEGLEDKKANDIRILDIEEISTIADYFIIASGTNTDILIRFLLLFLIQSITNTARYTNIISIINDSL